MMENRSLFAVLSLCFALSACGAKSGASVTASKAEASSPWPPTDSTLSGMPIYESFSQLAPIFQYENDTTYVINFWATWCKPCVEELPYFIEQSKALQGEPVRFILVSLDFPNQVSSRLLPFVEERSIQPLVAVLLDGKYNDWIDQVSPEWGGAIPATLIYKGGQRHFLGQAVHSREELQEAIGTVYRP